MHIQSKPTRSGLDQRNVLPRCLSFRGILPMRSRVTAKSRQVGSGRNHWNHFKWLEYVGMQSGPNHIVFLFFSFLRSCFILWLWCPRWLIMAQLIPGAGRCSSAFGLFRKDCEWTWFIFPYLQDSRWSGGFFVISFGQSQPAISSIPRHDLDVVNIPHHHP